MKVRVKNSLSARIGTCALHNSLFREAMDIKTSTINFDILAGIFTKHFPLLKVRAKDIEITVMNKVIEKGKRPEFEIEYMEPVKVSKHAKSKVQVKKKPRAKPIKLKRRK